MRRLESLRLDPDRPEPLQQQLAAALRAAIHRAELQPGERLPPARLLAEQLGVSRITVVQTYERLQEEGLLEGRVGRGTYVASGISRPAGGAGRGPIGSPLAHSGVRWAHDLLARAREPGVISFADGSPPAGLAPLEGFRTALEQVLREQGTHALGYEGPEGYEPLRQEVAALLGQTGLPCEPTSLIITSGTQQAISLVANLLVSPGSSVLSETPSYVGAWRVLEGRGARLVGVDLDGQGLRAADVDYLARRYAPCLLFTQPSFQNPTGQTMPSKRRRLLLELSRAHDVPILEDEAYRNLSYDGAPPPPLRALEGGEEAVIYVSSFSQFLVPGLRLGYMIVPPRWREELWQAKELLDLHSPGLIQRATHRYLVSQNWMADLERIRAQLRERRDAMLQALQQHLSGAVRWQVPAGGLFIWLELQDGGDTVQLAEVALERGVAFSPGALFYADGRRSAAMRLNFTLHPPPACQEGIARLARALESWPKIRPQRPPQPAAMPLI